VEEEVQRCRELDYGWNEDSTERFKIKITFAWDEK
jgi:hypothetical protein